MDESGRGSGGELLDADALIDEHPVGTPEQGAVAPGLRIFRDPVKGVGLLAGRPLKTGALVIVFDGPLQTSAEVTDFTRCLQVGSNLWLGPSGKWDDLVNHSCDPNCGLVRREDRWYLQTIRPVRVGQEISFDYSTSMYREPWVMTCACGAARCRGQVSDFKDLPPPVRDRYLRLGIVPEHAWLPAERERFRMTLRS